LIFKTKNIFSLLILFICWGHLFAQDNKYIDDRNWTQAYVNSIGLKMGNVFQLDYKHFISSDISLSASTGFYLNNQEGVYSSLTAAYNHDTHIKNLYWFYGGGFAARVSQFPFEIGMAGSLGFEVVSNDKLFNFFVDIQPTAHYPLGQQLSFISIVPPGLSELNYFVAASVGVRYILVK